MAQAVTHKIIQIIFIIIGYILGGVIGVLYAIKVQEFCKNEKCFYLAILLTIIIILILMAIILFLCGGNNGT